MRCGPGRRRRADRSAAGSTLRPPGFRRAEAARAEGFDYLHALVNEGRAAGASLLHSHSQLVWLREAPPAVAGEADGGLRELLHRARETELEVTRHADVSAFCHPAGRLP